MPVRSSARIALRYSASIRAWAHTKLIRQIVLTVTGTELEKQQRCLLRHAGRSQPAPGAIVPQSRGGSRWPRTIRIRQDASVTTAEPAIAVARDQVIDRVADHPWDELEDPCPLPARNLARNAQHGLGFYITLAVRQEGKGTRAITVHSMQHGRNIAVRFLFAKVPGPSPLLVQMTGVAVALKHQSDSDFRNRLKSF
jgi:hypothetical protein